MKDQTRIATLIRWIARIWGTLILAFVLFFVVAFIVGGDESGDGLFNVNEVITFIFFPVSTVIGLSIALKWEGLGGLITALGMIGLVIIRFDLLSNAYFMVGIAPPAILYMVYWYLIRRQTKTIEKNRHNT
ncbi:MAG: hypothetical protein DRI70_09365 [Bacteroidetes bacterium]|nr:MAG: hypothetical protein DRI70_09365 [Bacteroidota bacterium]